jgi:hypothetical protein
MSPTPFEQEYPEEARFIADVFAAGGSFPQVRGMRTQSVPPPRHVRRNAPCPCGSLCKAKRCHPEWTTNTPGYVLQWEPVGAPVI